LKTIFTISILFSILNIFAQNSDVKREIKYSAELGTVFSTNGETPFWLKANQYGVVPSQAPVITLRGSITTDYKKGIVKEDEYKLPKFDWGYGLGIVENIGKVNQLLIPEAYIKAKYGFFEIYAGRRKEIVGLVDTALTSGSYIWSGNALPIPQIQISTPNFVPLGFTKGFLSFKGNFAHGWFENSRTDVKNFYLHQKSFYFRLGKPNWKFHFYGGFNHQVQWGGELLFPDPYNQFAINGKVGSSFKDYLNVVTGRSLGGLDSVKVGSNDAGNRSGNHLGTVDIGFEIQVAKSRLLIYRQSIYDTGTLYYLSNITDGLHGISLTNKLQNNQSFHVNKFVIEYLNTYGQGGEGNYANTNSRLRGLSNYFNNAVYQDGWIYNNQIIGSPFMISVNEVPIKGRSTFNVSFNRLESFFLGTIIQINNIVLENKLSYTTYYGFDGVNLLNMSIRQFSGLTTFKIPINVLNRSMLNCSFSYDNGTPFNSNIGVYLGIQKSW
jgi:hypothetical protein